MATARNKSGKKVAGKRPGRKASKKAAASAGNERMDFLVDYMKRNPKCVYAEAAAAAKAAGHSVYPIMWGRAQVMLGRAKAKPRGQGKTAMAKKTAPTAGVTGKRRGPGRPPGSKNKPKTPSQATTPVKRGPGRPPRTPSAGLSIPIADGDLATMQQLVDAVNSGARASLRYDGGSWSLAVG